MDTFYQVFGFVAAICIGIIVLTAFFTAVGYFKNKTRGFEIVKMKGFVKDGRLVNVHMSSGQVYQSLRFIGFSDQNSTKGGVPFQLSQMVVCERQKGARVFFRPDSVRIIEEVEDVG
jgi:hypothetical protein